MQRNIRLSLLVMLSHTFCRVVLGIVGCTDEALSKVVECDFLMCTLRVAMLTCCILYVKTDLPLGLVPKRRCMWGQTE